MFLKLIHLSLHPGERIVKVVRQSKIKIIFPILLAFLIYLIAFFFLFYFISLGTLGMIFFGLLLFIGAFYAFYKFYFWYFNVLILTNKRVIDIDQKRFFERTVSDVSHERVKDVIVRIKGVLQTIFHLGTVFLVSEGANDNLELTYVKSPEKVRDLILGARSNAVEQMQDEFRISSNEKIRQIYEEIKELDEETLDRILMRLPEIIKEESERSFFGKR